MYPRLVAVAIGTAVHVASEQWVHVATAAEPPADALLVRPDGYVAWAGGPDSVGLQLALHAWFGAPAVAAAGVA